MNSVSIFSNDGEEDEIYAIIQDHWLDISSKITINADRSIDVLGDVRFPVFANFLTELPLKFNKVTGDFDCSALENLNNLKGSPVEVGGTFNCAYTNIKSLKYAPKYAANLIFDNSLESFFTGNLDCNYERVQVQSRNNYPVNEIMLRFLENVDYIPLLLKYQYYFEVWNEDEGFDIIGFENLFSAVKDGLK